MEKIITEYNYFSDTLKDVKIVAKIAMCAFQKAVHDSTSTTVTELLQSGVVKENVIKEKVERVENNDKIFKKLFRKLVLKCHPDKIKGSKDKVLLKECYDDLINANKKYNWGLMLKVTSKLGISIPEPSDVQMRNITDKIVEIKQKINHLEKSISYVWYKISDPIEKNEYLVNFIANLQQKK